VRFEHPGGVAYGIWEGDVVHELEDVGVLRNAVAA
jgi:hypothetical protein